MTFDDSNFKNSNLHGIISKQVQRGFTLLETMATLLVLSITTLAVTKLIGHAQKVTAQVDGATSMAFFEEMLLDRLNLQLGNMLFWITNMTDSCKWAGYYIHGEQDPSKPGGARAPEVAQDFRNPLLFHPSGAFPRGMPTPATPISPAHQLFLFQSLTVDPRVPSHATVVNWYKNNKATTDSRIKPVVDQISNCLIDKIPQNFPPAAARKGYYEYCLLLDSNETPQRRTELANGIRTTRQTESFQLATVRAQLHDPLLKKDLECCAKNDASCAATIGTNLNRAFQVTTTLRGVSNTSAPQGQQKISQYERTFFVQKQPRPIINCNNCQNMDDPAWLYECNNDSLCRCYCSEAQSAGGTFPSAVLKKYPECWAFNNPTAVGNLCKIGQHHQIP